MSALSRWLSRFCYNHPRFGIPNLMKYIAIGNVIVFLLDLASEGMFSMLIGFYPGYIAQGQIWRLVTFIFVPQNSSALWFVVSVMLYYFLGNELERVWGSVRFTVYYATGVVMTIVMGLLLTLAGSSQPLYYYVSVTMYYVNMSMFFAFATLYPEAQFWLYFILPVKAKWLAWLDVALFAWGIFNNLRSGLYLLALLPVAALLNYFIFFWDDILDLVHRGSRRVQHQTSRQTINFHAAQKKAQEKKGYLHKCAVCGITDADDPNMEFRYCSKCNGYYCYCMKHINNHVHIP